MSCQSFNEEQKIKKIMYEALRKCSKCLLFSVLMTMNVQNEKKNLFIKGLRAWTLDKKALQKCLGESVLICRAPNSFFSK